jgi:hypothetical protein
MTLVLRAGTAALHAWDTTMRRALTRSRDDRGDVPGWVLVTVMTAGLVMAIWAVAEGQLRTMLSNALGSVK